MSLTPTHTRSPFGRPRPDANPAAVNRVTMPTCYGLHVSHDDGRTWTTVGTATGFHIDEPETTHAGQTITGGIPPIDVTLTTRNMPRRTFMALWRIMSGHQRPRITHIHTAYRRRTTARRRNHR